MLNPFPSLLDYTFFAPTLLRIVAAIVIAVMVRHHFKNQREIRALIHPIVGNLARYLLALVLLIEAAVAVCLFVGFETQLAAIVGALLAIRSLLVRPRVLSPFDRTTDWLLLAVCVSLLITGAGGYAFDVPL
ncbi:MAG: hypothetical protein KGJ34_01420 [Patescibacteria group bacterium]|nr:hypothetical protein [Patescibacteria group bacterium]